MIDDEFDRELIEDGRKQLDKYTKILVTNAPYTKGVLKGIGGAPMRASTLPTDATERKKYPIGTGVLDYFPDAIAAIAHVSWHGSEQHNPGQPLHWARDKSADEADTMMRHFVERGTFDRDGIRHTAKMAWRALALLQKEIEEEGNQTNVREQSATNYGGVERRIFNPPFRNLWGPFERRHHSMGATEGSVDSGRNQGPEKGSEGSGGSRNQSGNGVS